MKDSLLPSLTGFLVMIPLHFRFQKPFSPVNTEDVPCRINGAFPAGHLGTLARLAGPAGFGRPQVAGIVGVVGPTDAQEESKVTSEISFCGT